MIEAIISGGQTGADQAGLFAAEKLGISTGGFAPKGWKTETGPAPWLGERFGLIEADSDDYVVRTKQNVLLATGTLIVGRRSRGSNRTEEECRRANRPCCWIIWPLPPVMATAENSTYYLQPNPAPFRLWLKRNNIRILNVAGNRESKNPGIGEITKSFLIKALQ